MVFLEIILIFLLSKSFCLRNTLLKEGYKGYSNASCITLKYKKCNGRGFITKCYVCGQGHQNLGCQVLFSKECIP